MKELSEELQATIAAYLDGALPPAEAARFEVYLSNADPELARRVLSMTLDKSYVKGLPPVETPADLSSRVMEAVERASLLNDVENLSGTHHRWWQSRGAIAAAVLLLLSGFSYFVIQAVHRPNNAWNAQVAGGQANLKDGGHDGGLAHGVAALPPASKGGSNGLGMDTDNMLAKSGKAGSGEGGAAGQVDTESVPEAILEKQLAKAQISVNQSFDESLKSGFEGVESPQAALESVKAAPRKFVSGSPVLLTLVARDASDPQRLRSLLEAYIAQDAAVTEQQGKIYDRNAKSDGTNTITNSANITNGTANFSNNAGNYTNNLTVDNSTSQAANVTANNAGNINAGVLQQAGNNGYQQQYSQGASTTAVQSKTLATNLNGTANYNQYNANRKTFEQSLDNNNNDTPRNNDPRYSYAQRGGTNRGGYGANGSPTPFRVVLRPAQLAEIANTFQVHAVMRGSSSYVINNERRAGEVQPQGQYAANDNVQRDVAAKDVTKSGGDELASASPRSVTPAVAPSPATAPAAAPVKTTERSITLADTPPATGAFSKAAGSSSGAGKAGSEVADQFKPKADETKKLEEQASSADYKAAKRADDKQTPAARQESAKSGNQWVECIISMESAPPEPAQQINADQTLNRGELQDKNSQNSGK